MHELLAPAGNREAFTAALESGADAIYLGGRMFGARHYAPNFSETELAEAVRDAHLRGVKAYVTVNTLLDDSEIPELAAYLKNLYNIGVDAIIVQDMGVAVIARTLIPNLRLHASTQMTVHNLDGVEYLARQGFKRVVLARELSLEDIKHICRYASIEIETFVHGALCICYSGQCLMSSMIGGRSGNRGKCAQPCRLPYQLVDAAGKDVLSSKDTGEYLLSPKDLCAIELLPELIAAGVTSFKIEGRMKRAEYVAIVVDSYRRAIDGYKAGKTFVDSELDMKNMAQAFNRGFTTAYLQGRQGRLMISDRRPNNRGVLIGRVVAYHSAGKTVDIKLDEALAKGDVIEFWVKVGGRKNVTITSLTVDGVEVEVARAGMVATVSIPTPVRPGDRVFRTFDRILTEKARGFFAVSSPVRRIAVTAMVTAREGNPLEIILRDTEGNTGRGVTGFIAQKALNRPLDEPFLAKQVGRLGTTVFELGEINCDISGNVMVPVSEINEARRQAVEALEAARLARYLRPVLKETEADFCPPEPNPVLLKTPPALSVNVDTLEKARAALENGADLIMFGGESFQRKGVSGDDYRKAVEMVRKKGKSVILNTPRIVGQRQLASVEADLKLFSELAPDAVSVGNLGMLEVLKHFPELKVYGDYPLNIYNSVTIRFFQEQNLAGLTLSPELNISQIEQLAGRFDIPLELVVHGYLPLMVSEYCVAGSFLGSVDAGNCSQPCRQAEYWLNDRKNEKFRIACDQYCRMVVLNAKELSMLPHVSRLRELGVQRLRIEGKHASADHVANITGLYRKLIDRDGEYTPDQAEAGNLAEHGDITRGHYFRGVL